VHALSLQTCRLPTETPNLAGLPPLPLALGRWMRYSSLNLSGDGKRDEPCSAGNRKS